MTTPGGGEDKAMTMMAAEAITCSSFTFADATPCGISANHHARYEHASIPQSARDGGDDVSLATTMVTKTPLLPNFGMKEMTKVGEDCMLHPKSPYQPLPLVPSFTEADVDNHLRFDLGDKERKEAKATASSSCVTIPKEKKEKKKKKGGKDVVGLRPKPRRPLSAYNLFFQHERERIIGFANSGDLRRKGNSEIFSSSSSPLSFSGDRDGNLVVTCCPSFDSDDDKLPSAAKKKGGRRNKMSGKLGGNDEKELGKTTDFFSTSPPSGDNASATAPNPRGRRARKGRRVPHGKISFSELAVVVSLRWRQLDSKTRSAYDALARIERLRYDEELDRWNTERVAEAERLLAEAAWKERGERGEEVEVMMTRGREGKQSEVGVDPSAMAAWTTMSTIEQVESVRPPAEEEEVGVVGLRFKTCSSVNTFERSRSDGFFPMTQNNHQRQRDHYFAHINKNDGSSINKGHKQNHQSNIFLHPPKDPFPSSRRCHVKPSHTSPLDYSLLHLREKELEQNQQGQQQQQQQQQSRQKHYQHHNLLTLASDTSCWQPLATFSREGAAKLSGAFARGWQACEERGQEEGGLDSAKDIALDAESARFLQTVFTTGEKDID